MEARDQSRSPASRRSAAPSTPSRRRLSLPPREVAADNADSPKRPRRLSDSDILPNLAVLREEDDDSAQTPSRRDMLTDMLRRPLERLRSFLVDSTGDRSLHASASAHPEQTPSDEAQARETGVGHNEGKVATTVATAKRASVADIQCKPTRAKSSSRVHLSMTSPKRQPDIRDMLMPKKADAKKGKPKGPSPARKGAGARANDHGGKCTPSSSSKPAKVKKTPPTNGKCCVAALKRSSTIGSGKHGQAQKKTQKDADNALSSTREAPAVEPKATQGNNEQVSPRSPSSRKRRRSVSPAPKKKLLPDSVELLAPEPSTKKRRQSMPAVKMSKSIAPTAAAPTSPPKKTKKTVVTPEDPHEAFAHYMAEGDSPSEVLPGLWLGGFNAWYRGKYLLGSERGEVQHIPRDMFFSSHKISHVVSLGPYRPECENFPDLEKVEHLDVNDCTEDDDVNDCPAQKLSDGFERLVMQLARWRLEDKNVFVHCRAGQSRSATIVLAYYTVIFNISTHDALAHLYQMRPGPRGVCPGSQFLQVLVLWESSDACKRARSQYSEESGRAARLKKDVEFLAEGWQNVLTQVDDAYTKGMFSDNIVPHLPQFVLDPRKHLLALVKMGLAL